MKAVFLIQKRKVVIEDIPVPEIKNKSDVLVRVRRVGICGSDIHYYLEGKIGDQIVENRIILGHEAAGDVMGIGKGVKNLKEGQKVAIEPGISCGMCPQCITGKPNLCPDVKFFGTPPVDGALREYVVMPERNLIPLPTGIDYNEGVLSEPLAIGLYGVRLSGFSVGDSVAIIGAGPIGLSILFSVVSGGAGKVFISDLLPARLDMAKKLGADRIVLATEEDIVEVVKKETSGKGVDIGYEAAGKGETFRQSTDVARIGGKAVIYGIPEDDRVEFNAHSIRRKELNIVNVRRSAHTTELAIELIKKSNLPFSSLVTHTFPIEKTEDALNTAAEYKDGVIKAVIEL
ncbi:MAG TPA: alcohol dehydrogenase catalytic domain-containing protein [bacterium]|nr:alcohol dehydrogenase catalytic domain-containing protein [bacterium]HPP30004.1 alcohol dehydrogenase catalytic domain-containing protein [bacterium]